MTLGLLCFGGSLAAAARADGPASQSIDRLMAAAWPGHPRERVAQVQPAAVAGDAEFVRRIYLDLVGRIPTRDETEHFINDRTPHKRARLIDSLLSGDEFPRHWMENLNARLMGGPPFTGNAEWRAWLEASLRQNKPWDEMVRAMLRARPGKPGDGGTRASGSPAQFLISRLAQGDSGVDLATRDVSRFFFGVDIQCARCHRHPEVDQWKQESYWGMAAFFKRSYPLAVKGKVYLAERATGEVEYATRGKLRAATPRFLTGELLTEPARTKSVARSAKTAPPGGLPEDPADYLVAPEAAPQKTRVPVPKFSRREKLVEVAVNGKSRFFKRAAVNSVWAELLGRGLVEPIDQMHDGNPPSQPDVLDFLAEDFVAHRFDLRHLIRTITNSRTYQLSSRHAGSTPPAEETFACARVRPLSSHQLALSLLVAAGYGEAVKASPGAPARPAPSTVRARLESGQAPLLTMIVANLGSTGQPYQPGVREALFQANSPAFEDILARGGLAARLAPMTDDAAAVREAFLSVFSRLPTAEEAARLVKYLQARRDRRPAACRQVVWALISSPEFRFNH